MSDQKEVLADGRYDCFATLHIKNGHAVVVLNNTFGLQPGTTIPLLRKDGNLLVEQLTGSKVHPLNGHAII